MIQPIFFTAIFFTLLCSAGFKTLQTTTPPPANNKPLTLKINTTAIFTLANLPEDSLADFVPKGYVIYESYYGDLNKDGNTDCILIVKGTDKKNFYRDEYRGLLDRNRRGLIILFKKNNRYEVALINLSCFSSENEDGGVYYAPELYLDVSRGNLIVNYAHGRYGYWSYTFRFQQGDFELIGYDDSNNRGPVINSETSINFLTKKKIVKTNTNENADSGEEVFKVTVTTLKKNNHIRLSAIKDFDELEVEED